ncbi:hypothetical protein A1O3_04532 [Capronia epimyces CBS 606.96]|uniref:Major facilitator superfamily (MFS) profile domain-containing protein n=1 Tax=Capronia epimyces CBS 606.96 TaxID=1182542 RepID=W9Y429_9EURO|nr:uncharacterized protein A1O3_04532 [Capronia epimyces CBS 606.96]EXJ87572.1 hypothetical protein A1O3_04532 [Capronia epimyces CBS 606.96]
MTLQEKNEEISALHFDSSEGRGSSVQNGNNGIGNGIVNGNGNGNGTTREVPEDALHRDFFESIPLFATLFGITFSYLAVFAAPLLVSVGLPVLEQTFGTTPDSVFIPASNTIGQCVALFVVGRLSDSFGRRWFVVFGNILSMIGYMVAARAYNTSVNIGGSFLFGLGAGVQLLTIMFALELVPFNRRYLTYAYILSAWGPILAIAAGIVFTFVATAEDSWRWIAYFAFITSFVSLVFTLVLYHPQPISDTHPAAKREVATKTDWIGTVVWTGSTVSFLLGIYLGGQRYRE